MEMNFRKSIQEFRRWFAQKASDLLFVNQAGTQKREIRFSRLKWVAVSGLVLFVIVVLFLPDEENIQFSHKASIQKEDVDNARKNGNVQAGNSANSQASSLWSNSRPGLPGGASQVNHNTSMVIGPKGGNAKTQLRAGFRLPVRIMDKFTVSQEQVPVLAELIMDSTTDSGLRLPAATRFYGEASFQKGAERATVQFKQISLPSGQIRTIAGIGAGKDGQPGLPGHVFSDGFKNTTGQLLTTFVSGLASGSMQTDIFGRSQGGIQNGLLNAVSQTAQNRAQMYGQKLQTEREWIEVTAGQEADVILSDSINLQEGGDNYDQR